MIRTLAASMQSLLTEQADKAAKDSGFTIRKSPLSGALEDRPVLEAFLLVATRALAAGNRAHKSKKDPRTWQLIQEPELIGCTQILWG